jgi:hypothetical protein
MRELADISEMTNPDLPAIQARISAGGEMYNAIREFNDAYVEYRELEYDLSEVRNQKDRRATLRRKHRAMLAAADLWANPQSPE